MVLARSRTWGSLNLWKITKSWLKLLCVLATRGASLVAQWERICLQCGRGRFNPWVREDPLEKEMATHSSIFAWKIPWTEEPGGLQSLGSQRVGHDWATNTHTHTHTDMKDLPRTRRKAFMVIFPTNCWQTVLHGKALYLRVSISRSGHHFLAAESHVGNFAPNWSSVPAITLLH